MQLVVPRRFSQLYRLES